MGAYPASVGGAAPAGPAGGGPGTFGIRESIFKFSHSKPRQKFQNLDPGPDSTRKSLQGTRWVYVGGGAAGEQGEQRGNPPQAGLWKPARQPLPLRLSWPRCGRSLRFAGRESIFKFCHSKSRQKFQNLDPGPDSTRKSLHGTRWVHEGGREAGAGRGASAALQPARAPTNRLGGMSGYGWAPLQAQRPLRRHPIQTATLLCRPLRCAGGNAASVASLTRLPPTASALGGLRAAAQGAGDAVLDPEGWALWVTGLCLPLPS
jgi:hypothetical protein